MWETDSVDRVWETEGVCVRQRVRETDSVDRVWETESVCQWRSKGGGDGGGPPRVAAKLSLYLKIWEGKVILSGENFRKGLEKSRRSAKKKGRQKFFGV